MPEPSHRIPKLSIIISRGTLDGIYPGLILANGARLEGIGANLFFTFFGLYAVLKDFNARIRIATVGNPALHVPGAKGLPLPTWVGALPGVSALATAMMKRQLEDLDIPPIPEFLEMIHDAGGGIYACKATVDMFHLGKADLCDQVDRVLTVGELYALSSGAQIIYT